MDNLVTVLKTLGHKERLRILALLAEGELTVSELVEIMKLSQPRVTQYIQSLESAGIIERLKEGSWVFSRIARGNAKTLSIVANVLSHVDLSDRQFKSDRDNLASVQARRAKSVVAFFKDVANDRGQLGDEYLARNRIDAKLLAILGAEPVEHMIDLGTGTGRLLNLFSKHIKRGTGIDNNSDMLGVARHNLSGAERGHISVQQGDLLNTDMPDACSDFVTIHQVLHYLHEPDLALYEASRLLVDAGRIVIVDYAAHARDEFREKYAHRRLGFTENDMADWLNEAGFSAPNVLTVKSQTEYPDVKIWTSHKIAYPNQTLQHRRVIA